LPYDPNSQQIILAVSVDGVGITRLPALLASAGFRVTLVAPSGLAIAKSRFVTRRIQVPRADAACLAATLRKAVEGETWRWVILGDEPILYELLKSPGDTWLNPWFPIPRDANSISLATSKFAFTQAAQEAGFNVPEFVICESPQAAIAEAGRFGFPVVLKAASGFAGSGVRVVAGPDDVAPALATLGPPPYMVQRHISGQMCAISLLLARGKPYAQLFTTLAACWPTPWSASTAQIFGDGEEYSERIGQLARLIPFQGFCGVDLLRESSTGRSYLIEFNPRPTPAYYLGSMVGVDFGSAFRAWMEGQEVSLHATPGKLQGVIWRMFPQHLFAATQRRSLPAWLGTLRDVPLNDPWLAMAGFRRYLTHYIPERWKDGLKRCLRRG
jgi:predicted ATP-grasp superfamily ATP-dependent carboligase